MGLPLDNEVRSLWGCTSDMRKVTSKVKLVEVFAEAGENLSAPTVMGGKV